MKFRDCSVCKGSGREIDPVGTGEELRLLRKAKKLAQQDIADHMGLSKQHICALEKGNRNWNDDLIARYKKAVNQ